ncbi:hypothetical protein NL676_006719 [Syzygium grande]|nr:hypothetical protein NL676_006719 [Syzygium grande]
MALKCLKPATVVSPLLSESWVMYSISPTSNQSRDPPILNAIEYHGNAGLPNDPTAQDDGNSRTSTCFSSAKSIVVPPDVL